MIKNILYSISIHLILAFLITTSFKTKPVIESFSQQTSVSFANSVSANELSPVKLSHIIKKNEEKKIIDSKISSSTKTQEKTEIKQQSEIVNEAEKNINQNKPTEDNSIIENKKPDDINPKIVKAENPKKDEAPKIENFIGGEIKNVKTIEKSLLSAKEKSNILSQLKICYNRAINENKQRSRLGILIKVKISLDGYIESDLNTLIDHKRYNNPNDLEYKKLIDNVNKALDLCNPLRNLPSDKYEIWKELILQFDP